MAREIVIWCDPCMEQDQRTVGRESAFLIKVGALNYGSMKPRSLALCAEHEESLTKDLMSLLDELGQTFEGATVTPPKGGAAVSSRADLAARAAEGVRHGRTPADGKRGNQCLWCPLTYSNHNSGFIRHLKIEHGFSGLKEAFGGTCPICGEGPYQQMLQHATKSHSELGTFEAATQPFTWARDHGDPHGVFAEVVARTGSMDPAEAREAVRAHERLSEPRPSRQ